MVTEVADTSARRRRGLTATGRDPLNQRKDDLYETPPAATRALLKAETLPHKLWEPAAGRGAIVDVLRAAGHEVIGSDLVDYGIPTNFSGRDFLMELKAPDGCEAIVTNPPFKLATEFVRHALVLAPRAYFLLRLAYLEGSTRSAVLEGPLSRVYVFRNRLPRMHRDGWTGKQAGSSIAFAWYVFERDRVGPTTLHRISWEKT